MHSNIEKYTASSIVSILILLCISDDEDTYSVNMVWTWSPAADHDDGWARENVAFPLALLYASDETLLDVLRPVSVVPEFLVE